MMRFHAWMILAACAFCLLTAGSRAAETPAAGASPVKLTYPEPLPVPDWLAERGRFVFMSERNIGNLEPAEAAELGADIVCGGTNAGYISHFGGPYVWDGQTRFYNMWTSETLNMDALRAQVDDAHKLGLKVIGPWMRMWHPQMLYLDHPEWQELTSPDAKPIGPDHVKDWPPVTGCWNSGFGDFYIRQCQEFIKALDWDGLSLDGWGAWTTCYCPACRESYRADTGGEIPHGKAESGGADINNPEFRRYLKWRLDRWNKYVNKWQHAVKETKSDFAAMPWSSGPGRWWHWTFSPSIESSDAANRLVDAPLLELFWDYHADQGNSLLPLFMVRYYRGLTAERPCFFLPYFSTQGQQAMVAPPVEADFRVLTVLTGGGRVALSSHQVAAADPRGQMRHHLDLIKEREPFTRGAETVKYAAMLVSESSRVFHGISARHSETGAGVWIGSGVDTRDATRNLPAKMRRLPAHMESAIGVFRAAQEAHLPLDIITEQDLVGDSPRLDRYKVLILPNAGCIGDAAIASITRFVERGGGLVALHESSMMNEFGDRRADFGLGELLGVSFQGVEDHTATWPEFPKPVNITLPDGPLSQSGAIKTNYRVEMKSLDFIGFTTKVKPAAGTRILGYQGVDAAALDTINQGPAAQVSSDYKGALPFITSTERGQGRVVYFAGDIGQAYFIAPYQYERALIEGAITQAGGEPPVRVEAPMAVQAIYYEQPGEQRRVVVHLLNEINTSGGRAMPEMDSSMREEIVPIANIRVCFAGPVVEAHLEPGHTPLELHAEQGGASVLVPRLDLHRMVVARGPVR